MTLRISCKKCSNIRGENRNQQQTPLPIYKENSKRPPTPFSQLVEFHLHSTKFLLQIFFTPALMGSDPHPCFWTVHFLAKQTILQKIKYSTWIVMICLKFPIALQFHIIFSSAIKYCRIKCNQIKVYIISGIGFYQDLSDLQSICSLNLKFQI